MFSKINSVLLLVLFTLFAIQVNAQELHGTIIDKIEGTPLTGVSIKLAGFRWQGH